MEADYPAAHSMDACWFGVDRDGRVGFFETGEAGAMPTAGLTGQPAEDARLRLARALPTCATVVDRRGRTLPYHPFGGIRHLFGGLPIPTIMFLDSLDPVRADLAAGRAAEIPAAGGFAVLWPGLSDADYDRLHDGDPEACRTCFMRSAALRDDPDDPRPNLARHGIYTFEALGTNATAYPYGVAEVPADPVHVDRLPPDLRTRVREVTFADISFADTPVFQPAEHVLCSAWDGSYEDMQGRPHAIPSPTEDPAVAEGVRQYLEGLEAEG